MMSAKRAAAAEQAQAQSERVRAAQRMCGAAKRLDAAVCASERAARQRGEREVDWWPARCGWRAITM